MTCLHCFQISRGSLKAFGPFFKLTNKTWTFPETKSSGDDNRRALKHQRLNRSPSYLTLTLCQFSLLPQRSALCQHHAGKQIDIIYLDRSKAFDKVDDTKLLGRLHQYGITGKLHDWFRSYLQERKQQVTVLGATSRELPVTPGVPQGSLLGPILFLLFVDDLPNTVKTSRVACYADDSKIFKSIDSITDCNALQSDLNDLVSWSESSGLMFNQSKCKYQCITCKKSPVQPT